MEEVSGLKEIKVEIEGHSDNNVQAGTGTVDIISLSPNTEYTANLKAVDNAGNISASQTINFKTDAEIIPPPKLQYSDKINSVLSSGGSLTIEKKCFIDEKTEKAIYIKGQAGTGNVVTIKGCKFANNSWCIHIEDVDTVIIESNYFSRTGNVIRTDNIKNIFVKNNISMLHGIFDSLPQYSGAWSKNFFQLVNSNNVENMQISGNIIDRLGDDRENVHENVFAEDYISIYKSNYIGSDRGYISNNIIRGGNTCESKSAGGIVIDQQGSGFTVVGNVLENTGQSLLTCANSDDIEYVGNKGFITFQHDFLLLPHSYSADTGGGGNNAVGMNVNAYGDGQAGSVLIKDNQLLAERSNSTGTEFTYYFNWMTVGDKTFINNNFDAETTHGLNIGDPSYPLIATDMIGTYATNNGFYFDVNAECE